MKSILLLEDEPIVMKVLRSILHQYRLLEATSAKQALRLFTDQGHRIDLLIADFTLPISSGIEVAVIIRSELPELPVILTSGYPVGGWIGWSDRDIADLEWLGTKSVVLLQKPFRAQILTNTVLSLIGEPLAEKVRTA